jgi:SRSO17 transposase
LKIKLSKKKESIMASLQCVIKPKKIIDSFKIYILSLFLTKMKKNCASMSRESGFSYSSILNSQNYFFYKKEALQKYFISLINLYATEKNPGVLISDSSQLMKIYATKIDCLCYDYNGCMKDIFKGITNTTLAWTNGKITIPIDFDFWASKKDIKDAKLYRKKTKISEELIIKWKDHIPFKYCLFDGEYGNKPFLTFLENNKLLYATRIACNRKVVIDGIDAPLKEQPSLKLIRNQKYKTAFGYYKGIPAYFTAHKRNGPGKSKQIVFIISNIENLSAKEYVDLYAQRWPIEKMFRTLKQSLGVRECQSTNIKKQEAHIYATFLAFIELEKIKIFKKNKSPEQVLHKIRFQNDVKKAPLFDGLEGFIM